MKCLETLVSFLIVISLTKHYILCFMPTNELSRIAPGDATNHRQITTRAIFDQVLIIFKKMPENDRAIYNDLITHLRTYQFDSSIFFNREDDFFERLKSISILFYNTMLQILDGNSETDNPDLAVADDPIYHFDAEMFHQTNERLIKQKKEILEHINNNNFKRARESLGQYTHTLQDFYSHSNWIEMNKTDTNKDIGIRNIDFKIADLGTQTCTNCEYRYIFFGPEFPPCVDNIIISDQLTSGYYGGQFTNGQAVLKPQGINKCSHGGFKDKSRDQEAFGGINKDSESSFISPHYYLHRRAVNVAIKATGEFLQDVREKITDEIFLCLVGISCLEVAFFFDANPSMGSGTLDLSKQLAFEIFNLYKTQVKYVNSTLGWFNDYIFQYDTENQVYLPSLIRNPYTVSNVSNATRFSLILDIIYVQPYSYNTTQFCVIPTQPLTCISSTERDEDEGPEFVFTALKPFLSRLKPNTHVYMFTDALPKEIEMLPEIINIVKEKNIRFICALCGYRVVASLIYREIVIASKGMYNVDFTNFKNFLNYLLNFFGDKNLFGFTRINKKNPSKTGEPLALFETNFDFNTLHIDKFMRNVSLFLKSSQVSAYNISLANVRSNETRTYSINSDTSSVNLSSITSGEWSIVYDESSSNSSINSDYLISIRSSSTLSISFRLYQNGSDALHPGFFFFNRKPYANEMISILITTSFLNNSHSEPFELTNVLLVSHESNLILGNYSLNVYDFDNRTYFSLFKTPSEVFYIVIDGFDSDLNRLRRFFLNDPITPSGFSLNIVKNDSSSLDSNVFLVRIVNKMDSQVDYLLLSVFSSLNNFNYKILPNNTFSMAPNQSIDLSLHVPFVLTNQSTDKLSTELRFYFKSNDSYTYFSDPFKVELNTQSVINNASTTTGYITTNTTRTTVAPIQSTVYLKTTETKQASNQTSSILSTLSRTSFRQTTLTYTSNVVKPTTNGIYKMLKFFFESLFKFVLSFF